MSEWISAREAWNYVKAADLREGDLIEWARQGRLHARADSGIFSSDDPADLRKFPNQPPTDELTISTLGPWPDIPDDIWAAEQVKVHWGAGTYEGNIRYWDEYHSKTSHEYIRLFNLTFRKADLEELLNGAPASAMETQVPQKRWQQKRLTQQQVATIRFLEIVSQNPPKISLGPVALHNEYVKWYDNPNNKQTGKPLKRTAFAKWKARYDDGHRVGEGRRLVRKP